MKKLFLFAAVAGLGLVSAGPPDKDDMAGPPEARGGYPPCSRTVTDNCIQLYERGVRSRENLARNHQEPAAEQSADAGDHGACRPGCTHARRQLAQRIRRAGERG
ncbi:MAG: hypothetical protein QOH47_2983 [Sphingomonadales bacterium]|nr:hypothetical protein [Sphingomonadales bacterium]